MRAVVMVVAATLVLGGVGLVLVARYAPARVAAVQVGPCELQAIDATPKPCASDPRLSGLGEVLAAKAFSGFGCFKPAAAPSLRTIEVLGRRGDRTRVRLRTSTSNSTLAVRDGSTVVVGDQLPGGKLHALALTCRRR
jgi:hypothetical protein